jgi:hypothetical protein
MLSICDAYDNVKLEELNNFRKKFAFQASIAPIFVLLKRHTEAFFNAYKADWDQEGGPCCFQKGLEHTCQGQGIEMFTRNEVGVCSTYAKHMLTSYQDNNDWLSF